ncbi:MAG: hypothetical protein AB1627_01180 [Chloroflexota bacterium]
MGSGFVTLAPINGGYRVWANLEGEFGGIERVHMGDVLRRERPSHIRRGRMQADPWWIAVPAQRAEPVTDVDGGPRWFQTRREAVRALGEGVPA